MLLAVLGHQPHLSVAELEQVYGAVSRPNQVVAHVDGEPYPHLGGSSKLARIVTTLPTADVAAVVDYLCRDAPLQLGLPQHKFDIGISWYGRRIPNPHRLSFEIKKQWRTQGLKPRFITGKRQSLSSAQVYHNRLDSHGFELIISIEGSVTTIARTVWVQNIEDYSRRDMERPVRDMDVGMLPPKLAQIMLNLTPGSYVYDPFCGSGVILAEALLMGRRTGGSDLAPAMTHACSQNLQWLQAEFGTAEADTLSTADARSLSLPQGVDAIVTEGYLGPVLHQEPDNATLDSLITESLELLSDTLHNVQPQLPPAARLCLALPSWRMKGRDITPPLVDRLDDLGYNQVRLQSVAPTDLLYRRPNQYVGRHLILLEKTS